MEKVGGKSPDLSHDRLPDLVSRIVTDVPIWKFRTLVSKEKCGVSGYVEHPFWEDLDVGPSHFIYQDLLHGAHKFFWDHPHKWIASLIGTECLDRRMSLLPKEGLHHFKSGISRSEEHTSELQSHSDLVCRLLLEKKKQKESELWKAFF